MFPTMNIYTDFSPNGRAFNAGNIVMQNNQHQHQHQHQQHQPQGDYAGRNDDHHDQTNRGAGALDQDILRRLAASGLQMGQDGNSFGMAREGGAMMGNFPGASSMFGGQQNMTMMAQNNALGAGGGIMMGNAGSTMPQQADREEELLLQLLLARRRRQEMQQNFPAPEPQDSQPGTTNSFTDELMQLQQQQQQQQQNSSMRALPAALCFPQGGGGVPLANGGLNFSSSGSNPNNPFASMMQDQQQQATGTNSNNTAGGGFMATPAGGTAANNNSFFLPPAGGQRFDDFLLRTQQEEQQRAFIGGGFSSGGDHQLQRLDPPSSFLLSSLQQQQTAAGFMMDLGNRRVFGGGGDTPSRLGGGGDLGKLGGGGDLGKLDLHPMMISSLKPKRQHKKKPADMPRRPLSAYNLFFSVERERILKEIEGKGAGHKGSSTDVVKSSVETEKEPKGEGKDGTDDDNACAGADCVFDEEMEEGEDSTKTPRALLQSLLPSEKKRRPHRKTHGKISFRTLAQMVGQRWKALPEGEREYYKELASADRMRQKKAMELYYMKQSDKDASAKTSNEKKEEMPGSTKDGKGLLKNMSGGVGRLAEAAVPPVPTV